MPRQTTHDRAPPGTPRATVYTVGQIGQKRKLRADGTLLCEDVPIARTGQMMYQPGEVPIKPPTRPGAAQVLYVTRDSTALFSPQALGSVIGAAVTNDHPPTDVDPMNWSTLAKGFVLDAWQGVGDEANLMFADIVISDKGLIHKVNSEEIREVSLGYAADYVQTGDGEGRQRNIIINHLALVERGRCGPRCAIGDRQTIEEEPDMPNPTQMREGGARPRNRLEAVRTALEDLENEQADEAVHVHVHMPESGTAATRDSRTVEDPDPDLENVRTVDSLAERLDGVEEGMAEQRGMLQTILDRLQTTPAAATGELPVRASAGDSAALQTSFQALLAQAEILVPGFRAPTFDSALPRAKTVDAMCATRRQVLTTLSATAEGAALIGNVADDDGFDVEKADCAHLAVVFKAAATLKGNANNRASTGDRLTVPAGAIQPVVFGIGGVKPMNGDEINAANAKFWANQ